MEKPKVDNDGLSPGFLHTRFENEKKLHMDVGNRFFCIYAVDRICGSR